MLCAKTMVAFQNIKNHEYTLSITINKTSFSYVSLMQFSQIAHICAQNYNIHRLAKEKLSLV